MRGDEISTFLRDCKLRAILAAMLGLCWRYVGAKLGPEWLCDGILKRLEPQVENLNDLCEKYGFTPPPGVGVGGTRTYPLAVW